MQMNTTKSKNIFTVFVNINIKPVKKFNISCNFKIIHGDFLRLTYGLISLCGVLCLIFGTLDYISLYDSLLLASSWILGVFLIGYAIKQQKKENKGS
jgi:hypothetical protein